jgi:hypothetical protein
MAKKSIFQPLEWLLAGSVVFVFAGCLNPLGAYRGPLPSEEDITDEVVIVRSEHVRVPGLVHEFIMDRVRFQEAGDPHNVDRVVRVFTTEETAAAVIGLHLQVGDRVTISTEYGQRTKVSGLTEVPNWPGHRYQEYPIGGHWFRSAVLAPDA